ncbi:MAG: hypothetical protein OEV40_03615 [Acidimicrobiia bacterium]|nr:hypothetical protein [Acidimicrobiia bacterium]
MLGSWIVDDQGKPGDPDLAAMFDIDVVHVTDQLADVYLALEPLQQATETGGGTDFDGDLLLDFGSVMILARPVADGLLVILADIDANLVKIRALSNLLMKRIERNLLLDG